MAACRQGIAPTPHGSSSQGNHPGPALLERCWMVRLDEPVFSLAARMVPGPAGIGLRLPGVSSIRAKALMSGLVSLQDIPVVGQNKLYRSSVSAAK